MKKLFWILVLLIGAGSLGIVITRAMTTTLYDIYTEKLGYFPSIEERQFDAVECGIENYRGSYRQNIKLRACLLNVKQEPELLLGVSPVDRLSKTLRTDITAGTNVATFDVDPLVTLQGRRLVMTDVGGDRLFFRLGSGDNITWGWCESMTDNTTYYTMAGCTLGLNDYGAGFATSTANIKAHSAGESFIITNSHHWYSYYLFDVKSTSTIFVSGTTKFENYPQILTYTAPVNSTDFVPKQYVDGISVNGASTSTETNMGIVELATRIEIASSTASSTEGRPLVIPSKWATSTFTAGLYLVATQNNGKIAGGFLDETYGHTWTASTSFTASSTFSSTNTTTITRLIINSRIINLGGLAYLLPLARGAASTTLFDDGSGNLVWAKPSNWMFIATSTAVATTSPFTISNIPADCSDMRVTLDIPGSSAADMKIRFNADVGANYASRDYVNYTLMASDGPSQTATQLHANSSTSTVQHIDLRIRNGTTEAKVIHWTGGVLGNSTAGSFISGSSVWNNTSDLISSFRLWMAAGSTYNSGTKLTMFCYAN